MSVLCWSVNNGSLILTFSVTVIGFTQNSVNVSEAADTSALLILRIISGVLAPGAWAEVKFSTIDLPSSDTSAVCKQCYELHIINSLQLQMTIIVQQNISTLLSQTLNLISVSPLSMTT